MVLKEIGAARQKKIFLFMAKCLFFKQQTHLGVNNKI